MDYKRILVARVSLGVVMSLVAVTALVVLLEGCTKETTPGGEELILDIKGMTCANCEATARRELEQLPGVKVLRVSAGEKGRAVVSVSRARVSDEDLRAAVGKAGFRMTGVRRRGEK